MIDTITSVIAKVIARFIISVIEGFGILYGMYFALKLLGLY